MENIALTTLVVFILAIPGYVARSAYHSGNLTGAVLRRSITNDLVWTIMIAMPIHAIGVFIVEHLHELWDLIPDINFEATFRLLTGEYGPESVLLTDLIGNVYQNSHYITAYVLFFTTTISRSRIMATQASLGVAVGPTFPPHLWFWKFVAL